MNTRTTAFALVAVTAALLQLGACTKSPEVGAAAVANVSDIDITEHVTTALRQNAMLKNFDITVVTLKGDVRLAGVLDNQAQIDEALKVARASEGAHSIHDELTIRK